MDSIKGAIELAARIANAGTPAPRPKPRVPDEAPPIYHWLGVKPTSASHRPSSARAV